jgi:ribosomal protein S18 acetylase RimI-like enzyme
VQVTAITQDITDEVRALMTLGAPYVHARTLSDYWLYARLFASTCPVAVAGDRVVGAAIAMRSQDEPDDIYLQDLMVHPEHRQQGIARALLDAVRLRGEQWRCRRLYLTSEPDNEAALRTWTALGFSNLAGDYTIGDISVTRDFKGPGRDRAVFELLLPHHLAEPEAGR